MAIFFVNEHLFQFQIKDAIKAARIEATEAYLQYVEEPKRSQRRWSFDLELALQDYRGERVVLSGGVIEIIGMAVHNSPEAVAIRLQTS